MEHAEEFFEKIQKLPLEVVSDFVFVRFGLSKAVFLEPQKAAGQKPPSILMMFAKSWQGLGAIITLQTQ